MKQMPPLPAGAPIGASVVATEELDMPPEHHQPASPPKSVSRKITVIARRAGFYMNHRRVEGDKFDVAKFDDLGTWMECVDPVIEKKRQEAMKKKAADKRAAKEDAGD